MIDKVRDRLSPWHTCFLYLSGSLSLEQVVLSAIPIFQLTSLDPRLWVFKAIDKFCRACHWKGTDAVKCPLLVSWKQICRPKASGGLGILDMEIMNSTLAALGVEAAFI